MKWPGFLMFKPFVRTIMPRSIGRLVFIWVLIINTGCSMDAAITSLVPQEQENDFALSEIISNSPAIANGSSELLVVIRLMNSDGNPVRLYKPTYEIVSGSGVMAAECTTSDNTGVSTCVLRSTQAGIKRLSVTNIKINLEKEVVFTPPTIQGTLAGVTAGAKFNTSSSPTGHILSGTVGSVTSELVKTGTNGWKIYGGPEGSALGR